MRALLLGLMLLPLAGCLADAPGGAGDATSDAGRDGPAVGSGVWRVIVDCTQTPLGYSCDSNDGATSNCLTVSDMEPGVMERVTVTASWDPVGEGTHRMEVHAWVVGTGERAMAVGSPGTGLVLDPAFLADGGELRLFVTPEQGSLTVADDLPVDLDLVWLGADLSPRVAGGVCI